MDMTFNKAIDFVKEHIKGTRKGSDIPQYQHSINVAQILFETGQFNGYVVEAGLLHDILEDTDITSSKLVRFGVLDETIRIVELCSHDNDDDNSDARYLSMLANLVRAEDQDAWAVKLADTRMLKNLKNITEIRFPKFVVIAPRDIKIIP